MRKIIELFGLPTIGNDGEKWKYILKHQHCPYLDRKCIKVRKSAPEISIGTCSVFYGKNQIPVLICPHRFLERRQIFTDCLHLLTRHEPGNELHIISEITVPGGSIDFFLVSVKDDEIKDFVGVEIQTLDTTGTVWPERQRFLQSVGLKGLDDDLNSLKGFGMNWKMTAKTILVQLHHKLQSFENINKHLTLVIQDHFLRYMRKAFQFDHLNVSRPGDPMHFHVYEFKNSRASFFRLNLFSRLSTDTNGIAKCLGLRADPKIEFESIVEQLQKKISQESLFTVS